MPSTPGNTERDLDCQVRGHYGTWRDRPPGRGCLIVLALLLLTTALAGSGIALFVHALI